MNGGPRANVRDPGLQPERTALAWTRTSFAVLGNSVILVIKQFPHYRPGPLILAGFTAVVALTAYLIGLQRQRTLARRPLSAKITPRREVHVIGALVITLTIVIGVWLFL